MQQPLPRAPPPLWYSGRRAAGPPPEAKMWSARTRSDPCPSSLAPSRGAVPHPLLGAGEYHIRSGHPLPRAGNRGDVFRMRASVGGEDMSERSPLTAAVQRIDMAYYEVCALSAATQSHIGPECPAAGGPVLPGAQAHHARGPGACTLNMALPERRRPCEWHCCC